MGEILEDMTKASREKIEKYTAIAENAEAEEETMNLEEARENGDWLFIFAAAREIHLFQGTADDPDLCETGAGEGISIEDEARIGRFQPMDYEIRRSNGHLREGGSRPVRGGENP